MGNWKHMFRMKLPTSGFTLQSVMTRTRSRGLTRAFASFAKTCYSLIMQIRNYRKNCGATSIPPAKTWTAGSKNCYPPVLRTKAINRSVSDYQDKPDEYSNSVYEGGELFLYELWKTMGDKTFFQMLHKYYQTYQFQIVTTDDFLKIVRSYGTDKKLERIIGRYIEEK